MDIRNLTHEQRNAKAVEQGFKVSGELMAQCLRIGNSAEEKFFLIDVQYSSAFFLICLCLFNKAHAKQNYEQEIDSLISDYGKSLKERLMAMKQEQKTGGMKMLNVGTGEEPEAFGVVQ